MSERSVREIGNLCVLGSTGSIGRQTLDVVRANPERFRVISLAAHANVEQIVEQAREFRPDFVALSDKDAAREAERRLGSEFNIGGGEEAVLHAATLASVHTVVAAIVGFAGLEPVLAAIGQGKHIALANKESLVAGGPLVQKLLKESSSVVVPVDSEHNSVFQCLLARGNTKSLRRIILTASGGPFLNMEREALVKARPVEAVRHPRWNMGAKISVDSATLMNKGLEVIEASVLFDLPGEQVEVLIHPQSLVHGFVEYLDGTVLAALFETDMRVPISFALSYLLSDDPRFSPGCQAVSSGVSFLDLAAKGDLQFFAPDREKFPALALCYQALETGGTMPAVVNAANEVAVNAYLREEIGFTEIHEVIVEVMGQHSSSDPRTVEDVVIADSWARDCASKAQG